MKLVPITVKREQMQPLLKHSFIEDAFEAWQRCYPVWGFHLPLVGYFALEAGQVVGVGGFKGPPRNLTIELSYGVVPEYQGNGIGSRICEMLVQMALKNDPKLRITARTLPKTSASTSILKKNHFINTGTIKDPEDGPVWEWVYSN